LGAGETNGDEPCECLKSNVVATEGGGGKGFAHVTPSTYTARHHRKSSRSKRRRRRRRRRSWEPLEHGAFIDNQNPTAHCVQTHRHTHRHTQTHTANNNGYVAN